jgi:chemotaxis signal transduction protein
LRVDDVLEVATLPLSDIYALPRLAAAQQRGAYVSGIGRRNGELVVLLDPVALARMAGARAVDAMAAPPRQ